MKSTRQGVVIEKYLRDALEKGIIDHSLRASVGDDGFLFVYIHPTGKDGDTMDYEVKDDQLLLRY